MEPRLYQALRREAGDKKEAQVYMQPGHRAAQVNNEQIGRVGGRPWQRADTGPGFIGEQHYVFKELPRCSQCSDRWAKVCSWMFHLELGLFYSFF